MQPDMTLTLDMLHDVRTLYGWGLLTGMMNRIARTDPQLWRLEQYLIRRLERAGLAAPPDTMNDDLHELAQHDTGENGAG